MKTELQYLFGPEISIGILLSVILLALLTGLGYLLLRYFEAKEKRDNELETRYKHRELGNADLYQRKH